MRYANYKQWSHDGWRPLISSFITAFKNEQTAASMAPPTGIAAVGSLWYKTMLKSAVCPLDPGNDRANKPDGWESGTDALNWAIVAPAGKSYSVRLISNGQVVATIALKAGLNYGSQIGVRPGLQRMELIDASGKVLLAAAGGRCISSGCPDCIYNMNYQVVELKADTGNQGTCPYRVCKKQVFAHYMVDINLLTKFQYAKKIHRWEQCIQLMPKKISPMLQIWALMVRLVLLKFLTD